MDTTSFFQYPGNADKHSAAGPQLFEEAGQEDWQILFSYMQLRRYSPGDLVITQGDDDDSLLLVAKGELEILLPHSEGEKLKRLSLIGAGSVIGEQSFFDRQPRSTSIRALTDVEIMTLNHESYMIMAARDSRLARMLIFDLGRIVSLRLRRTTEFLAHGKEQQ